MELVLDNYYYGEWGKGNNKVRYIFQARPMCDDLAIDKGEFFIKAGVMYTESTNMFNVRPATEYEENWIKACQKAGKFVPKEEIKVNNVENYDIWN